MKTTVTQWATKAAGAGAIALLLTAPAFAQPRGSWNQDNTNNDRNGQASGQRDNGNRHGNNGQADTQRDSASGRLITADVNGRSLRNLRRGEYVELTGQWIRGSVFDVASIGSIRGRR